MPRNDPASPRRAETLDDLAIPSRIDACEAPAYHLARRVQPHGRLIAFDPATRLVVRASANIDSLLGRPPDTLIGQPLGTLFEAESLGRIQQAVAAYQDRRVSLLLTVSGIRPFSTTTFLYRGGGLFCIDIESGTDDPPNEFPALRARFFEKLEQIGRADVASERLAGIACDTIREITGFDRVYYCHFDRLGHGHVQGESNSGALPNLLDHHFPATDIPQAARAILVANPFRLIPDVDGRPVDIIGGDGTELDLTLSTCRAIAPTHLQYLRNMGVQASVSFGVTVDGTLQALFGGHHHCPRGVSLQRLVACQHLVELFKTRFEFLRIREDRTQLKLQLDMLCGLSARFRLAGHGFRDFLATNHDMFRDLTGADDVLCRFEGVTHLGRTLAAQDATTLLDFVARRLAGGDDAFETDCIAEHHAALINLAPAVAGVLAIPLDLARRDFLVWVRAETVVRQSWSGDPSQPVTIDETGAVGPRTSFAAYVRETRGTCQDWPSTAVELARQLRHAFSQVLAARYEAGMRVAAERANALKSAFIANISHELRSPMHAIIGLSGVLAAAGPGLADDKRRQYAGTIRDNGERLLRLINDLLDLSQLEAGKMRFDFAPADIVATIAAASGDVAALAAAKQIAIVNRSRPDRVTCPHDATRIRQVMINLLSNAIKFSPPGETVTVSVGLTDPGPGGRQLVIEVADHGAGIPEDETDSVFETFVQSSRTRSGAGGTGLGLSICREIVEAHHGRIWAANNPSGGASLFTSLPILIGGDRP